MKEIFNAEILFEQANHFQYKLKECDKASRLYLEAIEIQPFYVDAINNYAQNLRINIRDYVAAIDNYSKVIKINPIYEFAHFRRGIC